MENPFDYSGKRVVVTGAFSGVGAALVDLLKEIGAQEIIALDIHKPDGPIDRYIETNMGDTDAVAAAAAAIEGPVDVLFNNAGIAGTNPTPVVMQVNYLGLRQLSELLLEKMPVGASIVNTASIAGGQWPDHLGEVLECLACPDPKAALAWCEAHAERVGDGYAFSKECVQIYTMQSAKQTIARGVRTNSVCPAPIDTPLIPDFKKTMTDKIIDWTVEQCGGTIATPLDIAKVLAFLGSDASVYVNGVNLNVDAGFNAFMTTGQVDFSGLA